MKRSHQLTGAHTNGNQRHKQIKTGENVTRETQTHVRDTRRKQNRMNLFLDVCVFATMATLKCRYRHERQYIASDQQQ